MFRMLPSSSFTRPFFKLPTFKLSCKRYQMGVENVHSQFHNKAHLRLCNVSGYMTELLEIDAPNPIFHLLFIPGNPGVVAFYKDFVESLYELLGGNVSIKAIGHISHTSKDWEHGRLFSLQEQIDHKMDFITQVLPNKSSPVILVGHSIGSYIAVEMFKRASHKVICVVGLYPFLALNTKSSKQTFIKKLSESSLLSSLVSSIVALLGVIPSWSKFIVRMTLGKSWSPAAVEAACSHLVKYHTVRNMLFMAKTEFQKFSEEPDWDFLKENQAQIAFLFGIDDHWGPLTLFEEIAKQAPDISLSIEKEGHDHSFSCTEAGSVWVAQHVASLIKKYTSKW